MKKNRFGMMKYILLMSATVFGVWYWQTQMNKEPVAAYIPIPVVRVIQPQQKVMESSIVLGGYVEADSIVTVLPQVEGRLDQLLVKEGDMVSPGTLIAVIDKISYQLQADQAESAFVSARSSFERIEKLYTAGAATQQTYDQTKAQYDVCRSQYELAQLQLTYTNIQAPVSGTILIRHASVGELVASQSPIVTIADLDRLRVRVHVPETYYDLFMKKYKQIPIVMRRPDNGKQIISGHMVRVASYIDPKSKSFEAICVIDNPEAVRPGMYLDIFCVLESHPDQYVLPYAAQTSEGIIWYVDPNDSTAHRIQITPLVENDDGFSISQEYRDLLVIIDGQHFLRDRQRVRIYKGSD